MGKKLEIMESGQKISCVLKKATMSAIEILEEGKRELKHVSNNPLFESQYLLSHLLNIPPGELHFKKHSVLDLKTRAEFLKRIQLRKNGRPPAYITGETEFFSREFDVGPGVFIPRPETEQLVDLTLSLKGQSLRGVDFGAGSGCVALSVAMERPFSRFVAVENSPSALSFLKKNQAKWNLKSRVQILNKNVSCLTLKNVEAFLGGIPNVITANPPYVDKNDKELEDSVRNFEPPEALFSEKEGLAHIYSWFSKAMELLEPGGVYIFEMGHAQEKKARSFLSKKTELKSFKIHKDIQGRDRTVFCMKTIGS